jgi:hypothetical protein
LLFLLRFSRNLPNNSIRLAKEGWLVSLLARRTWFKPTFCNLWLFSEFCLHCMHAPGRWPTEAQATLSSFFSCTWFMVLNYTFSVLYYFTFHTAKHNCLKCQIIKGGGSMMIHI